MNMFNTAHCVSVLPQAGFAPLDNELVLTSDEMFAQVVQNHSLSHLVYVGYAANRDVLWGDGAPLPPPRATENSNFW